MDPQQEGVIQEGASTAPAPQPSDITIDLRQMRFQAHIVEAAVQLGPTAGIFLLNHSAAEALLNLSNLSGGGGYAVFVSAVEAFGFDRALETLLHPDFPGIRDNPVFRVHRNIDGYVSFFTDLREAPHPTVPTRVIFGVLPREMYDRLNERCQKDKVGFVDMLRAAISEHGFTQVMISKLLEPAAASVPKAAAAEGGANPS